MEFRKIDNLEMLIRGLTTHSPSFEVLLGNNDVNVEFWILRCYDKDSNTLKLIYGILSAAKSPSGGPWLKSSFRPIYSAKNLKENIKRPELAKLSIITKGDLALCLINSLFNGKTLSEVVSELKLPSIDTSFGSLKLGIKADPKSEFVFRPAVISTPKNMKEFGTDNSSGITSVERDTISLVASLFRIDKSQLWKNHTEEPFAHIKEYFNGLVERLSSETGLLFQKSDISRLGNIEWIVCASKTKDERPLYKVDFRSVSVDPKTEAELLDKQKQDGMRGVSFCKTITVDVLDGAFTSETQLLVQCAGFNGNDLISDQSVVGKFPADRNFSFEFTEQLTAGSVKIYSFDNRLRKFVLWHCESFGRIRTIRTSVNLRTIPKSKWLDKLLENSSADAKVPSVITADSLALNDENYIFDPWSPISAEMRSLNARVNPPQSNAAFVFPISDENNRVSELSEWVTEVCKRHNAQTCLLMDPFFDVLGMKMFLKASISETEMVVITNCQCRSNDDNKNDAVEKKRLFTRFVNCIRAYLMQKFGGNWPAREVIIDRAQRIECFGNDNANELKTSGIRIYDLRSKSGSLKQLFHDRYVLFFNKSGRLDAGYTLSNSIQGAMKSYPLLITPIPEDVLEPIERYIRKDVIKENAYQSLRLIFTTHKDQKHHDGIARVEERKPKYGKPGLLFRTLLDDAYSEDMNLQQCEEILRSQGRIDANNQLPPNEVNVKRVEEKLKRFNTTELLEFWKDFSIYLSISIGVEDLLRQFSGSDLLVRQIKILLSSLGGVQDEEIVEDVDYYRQYMSDIKEAGSFEEHLKKAKRFINYYRGIYSYSDYGVSMAVRILFYIQEYSYVEIFEDTMDKQTWSVCDLVILNKAAERLVVNANTSAESKYLQRLANSRNAFLKALAPVHIFQTEKPIDIMSKFANIRTYYSDEELVAIFSGWILNLKNVSRRKGGDETEEARILRRGLIAEILERHPAKDLERLKKTICACSGDYLSDWSLENYQEIGQELVINGKYDTQDMAELWLTSVLTKMEGVQSSDEYFNYPADANTTGVAVHILLSLLIAGQGEQYVVRMTALNKRIFGQLSRTRSRAMDPVAWSRNFKALLWLQCFITLLEFYDEFKSSIKCFAEISDMSTRNRAYINQNIEPRDYDPEKIYAWYSAVLEKIRLRSEQSRDVNKE